MEKKKFKRFFFLSHWHLPWLYAVVSVDAVRLQRSASTRSYQTSTTMPVIEIYTLKNSPNLFDFIILKMPTSTISKKNNGNFAQENGAYATNRVRILSPSCEQ